jgi:hypothetical protein
MKHFSFRKFVRDHQRNLIILGASMAACSLLLKEVVREDLKELKDSVEGAKNAFVVRSDFIALGRLIVEVGTVVAKSNPQAPQAAGQAQNSDTPENLRDDVELRLVGAIEVLEGEAGDVEDLLEVLGGTEEDKSRLQSLKQNLSHFESELESAVKARRSGDSGPATSLQKLLDEKESDTFRWVGHILDEAQDLERTRARRYKIVKYATYGFLIIAAILAFLSRVFDIRVLKPSE